MERISDYLILIGIAVFVITTVVAIFKRQLFSPVVWISFFFILFGLFTINPLMVDSKTRIYSVYYETGVIYILTAGVSFFSVISLKRPPKITGRWKIHWKYLSERHWYLLMVFLCLLDLGYTLVTHGRLGLFQGHASMGEAGGGAHYAVFSTITYISWVITSMVFAVFLVKLVYSGETIISYLISNKVLFSLIVFSILLNTLGGNRFLLVFKIVAAVYVMRNAGKIRLLTIIYSGLITIILFVVIGNFRFGEVDVRDQLKEDVSKNYFTTTFAWVVTYSEPALPNLNNFLVSNPPITFGRSWFTSVMPGFINSRLNLSRFSSVNYLASNDLLVQRGQTFRTFYPDLIMDFGLHAGVLLGLIIVYLSQYLYCRSNSSPFWMLVYAIALPGILFLPFLNQWYQLVGILPFAAIYIVNFRRQRLYA